MAKRHKRHGGMKKGSAAAKAWGRKMKRLRAGKHVGKKRHYKKHTVKAPKRHYKKHSGAGRRHYHKRMKVRKIMVPAAWGKGYRRRGYKRIKVLSNPSGKLFSWLKFGGLVLAGFAGATAFNKLINTYVLKSKPQPAWLTGLVLSAAAILFGKKVWKKMPESFITGIVTNTLVSAVAQFAPKYLEWVIPSGAASLALPAGTSFYPALDKYVPSGDALMDYGNPYNSFGGDSNPLTASPFAGGIY